MFDEIIDIISQKKKEIENSQSNNNPEFNFFQHLSDNYNLLDIANVSDINLSYFMIAQICSESKILDFETVYKAFELSDDLAEVSKEDHYYVIFAAMSEISTSISQEEFNECLSGNISIRQISKKAKLAKSTSAALELIIDYNNEDHNISGIVDLIYKDGDTVGNAFGMGTALKMIRREKNEFKVQANKIQKDFNIKLSTKERNKYLKQYLNENYNLNNINLSLNKINEHANQLIYANKIENKKLSKRLKEYSELERFIMMNKDKPEIFELPKCLSKLDDEEIKVQLLKAIYKNNLDKYNTQSNEYEKLSQNSFVKYQLLFEKYGLDISKYSISSDVDVSEVSTALDKLFKINLNKEDVLNILNNSSINAINSIYNYLAKGYISQNFVKNNIDIFNINYDNFLNNISYFLEKNMSVSLIQKCENNLNEKTKLVKMNIDALEQYDLLKYLKKTNSSAFISKENLNEIMDRLLELGFENDLKNGLDLLNYNLDQIKKIKLCSEIGIDIRNINGVVANGLDDIPTEELSNYLYNGVSYNEPSVDEIRLKSDFLNILSSYDYGNRLYNIDGVLISKNKVNRKLAEIESDKISTNQMYKNITNGSILNDQECQKIVSAITTNNKLIKK